LSEALAPFPAGGYLPLHVRGINEVRRPRPLSSRFLVAQAGRLVRGSGPQRRFHGRALVSNQNHRAQHQEHAEEA
jgi:hypothetical protein